jgi:hypothetical protein
MNCISFIRSAFAILLMSTSRKIGLVVLQQFAHERQSIDLNAFEWELKKRPSNSFGFFFFQIENCFLIRSLSYLA